MIGSNDHLLKRSDSALLDDAVARFLAGGGTIYEAPSGQSMAKGSASFQQPISPSPATRRRRQKQAQEREQAEKPVPRPKQLNASGLERRERDAKVAEMAKTMTSTEVSNATGIHKRTLVDISRRRGFKFLPGLGNNVIAILSPMLGTLSESLS